MKKLTILLALALAVGCGSRQSKTVSADGVASCETGDMEADKECYRERASQSEAQIVANIATVRRSATETAEPEAAPEVVSQEVSTRTAETRIKVTTTEEPADKPGPQNPNGGFLPEGPKPEPQAPPMAPQAKGPYPREALMQYVDTFWTENPLSGCRPGYNLWVANHDRGVSLEVVGRGLAVCTDGQNLVPVFIKGRRTPALVIPPKGIGAFVATIGGPIQIAIRAHKVSRTDGLDPRYPAGPVYCPALGTSRECPPLTTTIALPLGGHNGRQLDIRMGAFGLEK